MTQMEYWILPFSQTFYKIEPVFYWVNSTIFVFMINFDQIKAYKERLKALYGYLDIEKKQMLIEDEQGLTHDPNFWDDPKGAEVILKNIYFFFFFGKHMNEQSGLLWFGESFTC